MSRRCRAMGLLVVCSFLIADAGASSSGAFTIRIGQRNTVSWIGPWRIRDPSLRRAIQVFGRPSSQRAVWPGFAGGAVRDCEVTWSWLGLRVLFTTLDIEPGACNPNKVIWIARVTSKQWRTWRGLRVGDRYGQIRAHHPRASLHHGIWWLATFRVPWGNRSLVPTVTATTHAGRVNGFGIWVQAQGE